MQVYTQHQLLYLFYSKAYLSKLMYTSFFSNVWQPSLIQILITNIIIVISFLPLSSKFNDKKYQAGTVNYQILQRCDILFLTISCEIV